MFIEEIIIDGFKSYATKTVITGFDEKFNAITGLNGSGKSNILDAICFVLGISNLSQVRASNLQELVYKQGQAGVTKAKVTVIFNNKDKQNAPVGYEKKDALSITRQIVIGGKNKYFINGHVAQLSQVHNLFHSVQLNVNNPHFLIMQGRITKVLNMKPMEILSLIEEAAGTRMYETKKKVAIGTMEKKHKKVVEINSILMEEITPTLEKLRKEKVLYLQYADNEMELVRLEKWMIAYQYVASFKVQKKLKDQLVKLQDGVLRDRGGLEKWKVELEELVKRRDEMKRKKEGEMKDEEYGRMKVEQMELGKSVVKMDTRIKYLEKQIGKERAMKGEVEKGMGEMEEKRVVVDGRLKGLEKRVEERKEENLKGGELNLEQLERELHAITTGAEVNKDGGKKTLNDAWSEQENIVHELKSKKDAFDIQKVHLQKNLKLEKKKLKSMKQNGDTVKMKKDVDKMKGQIEKYQQELDHCPFDEARYNAVELERNNMEDEMDALQRVVDTKNAQVQSRVSLDFQMKKGYKKNYSSKQIKGLIASLIQIKDPKNVPALEIAAGGKLYHIVVETEAIGKEILKYGQLKKRLTFIPLNRVQYSKIPSDKINRAQQIANKIDNGTAFTAVSCIHVEDDTVMPAIQYAFGSVFICNTPDVAKKITFNKDIRIRSVTLDGDAFDPSGTLQGGSSSRSNTSSLLGKLQEVLGFSRKLDEMKQKLTEIRTEYDALKKAKAKAVDVKRNIEFKQRAMDLLQQKIQLDETSQVQSNIEELEQSLAHCSEQSTDIDTKLANANQEIKQLSKKIASLNSTRSSEMKRLEKEIKVAKASTANGKKAMKALEQEQMALRGEIEGVESECTQLKEQCSQIVQRIKELTEESESLQQQATGAQSKLENLEAQIDEKEKALVQFDTELKAFQKQEQSLKSKISTIERDLKQNELMLTRQQSDLDEASKGVQSLIQRNDWIESEKDYFGQEHTDFCFKQHTRSEAAKKIEKLQAEQSELSKSINKKVMGMIEKAESEYKNLLNKREIIDNDKTKIQSVIKELDAKKVIALNTTWNKVNHDFGDIFSTLLPGATAKLVSCGEEASVLDGLIVKVAFGGVWKASLTELSGGQRSLLALSLILALLLFKPAPMYILDEVDAALDLSHTQNIGQMIKRHFSHSQFIIVSLKEGMFNNANVVFRTAFVDGVSTVSRTINKTDKSKRKRVEN